MSAPKFTRSYNHHWPNGSINFLRQGVETARWAVDHQLEICIASEALEDFEALKVKIHSLNNHQQWLAEAESEELAGLLFPQDNHCFVL